MRETRDRREAGDARESDTRFPRLPT
jgi:hypothetical protein